MVVTFNFVKCMVVTFNFVKCMVVTFNFVKCNPSAKLNVSEAFPFYFTYIFISFTLSSENVYVCFFTKSKNIRFYKIKSDVFLQSQKTSDFIK